MCLGPAPASRGNKGWIVRHKFPARRVQPKDKDSVKPFVGHGDEPAARIKHSVVGMRAGLLFAIWAWFSGQIDQISARPQRSILFDRHHADCAGAVIGGDNPAASRIDQ